MDKKLIILFHGFASSKVFDQVRQLGADLFPEDEIYTPHLAYRNRFAPKRINSLISEELSEINRRARHRDIDEVIFLGYSMGALTLRRIIAEAHGVRANDAPLIKGFHIHSPLPFTQKISRFVAVAGMAEPWSMQDPKNPFIRFLWHLGKLYCAITPLGQPIVMDFENTQNFVTHTQQAWNKLLTEKGVDFDVVRLHGTKDSLVLPHTSKVFHDGETKGKFFDIKLEKTGHEGIINLRVGRNLEKNKLRQRRKDLIGAALVGEYQRLQR